MRAFYDRIGGGLTVFGVGLMVLIIVVAAALLIWGGPTKAERIDRLEDRVSCLEAGRTCP